MLELSLKIEPQSALDSWPKMGTFPGHFRGLGERPKHQSPLIQIGFIKQSLGLRDGWCVGRVLTGRKKRSPASRCSWPQLMALPWKMSMRTEQCCFFWTFEKFPLIEEEAWIYAHGWDCSEGSGKAESVCPAQGTEM